ncbi:hypothetical protein F5884DRAFT_204073 [Xylogone sp. PMI_703]|nr:hypothetical protein F5884DRAFT_204073 [Xylogone sp. PMI_703]
MYPCRQVMRELEYHSMSLFMPEAVKKQAMPSCSPLNQHSQCSCTMLNVLQPLQQGVDPPRGLSGKGLLTVSSDLTIHIMCEPTALEAEIGIGHGNNGKKCSRLLKNTTVSSIVEMSVVSGFLRLLLPFSATVVAAGLAGLLSPFRASRSRPLHPFPPRWRSLGPHHSPTSTLGADWGWPYPTLPQARPRGAHVLPNIHFASPGSGLGHTMSISYVLWLSPRQAADRKEMAARAPCLPSNALLHCFWCNQTDPFPPGLAAP